MRNFAGNAALLTACSVASLVINLVIYPVIAARFAMAQTDEFFLALALPTLVVAPLTNALASLLVPVLAQCRKDDPSSLEHVLGAALGYSLLLAAAGALLVGLGAPLLLAAAGVWLEREAVERVSSLTLSLLPLVLLQTAHAVMAAGANCAGRFWLPAGTGLAGQLALLALAGTVDPGRGSGGLVAVFVAAALVDLGLMVAFWPRGWVRLRLSLRRVAPLGPLWRLSLPVTIGTFILQGGVVGMRLIAAGAGTGAITALDYAVRAGAGIMEALTSGVLTVTLTAWSHGAAEGDRAQLRRRLAEAVRMMLFLCLPVLAVLHAARAPLIELWLHGASGGAAFVALVATTFGVLLLGIPADIAGRLYARFFVVSGQTRLLAWLALLRVGAMLALAAALLSSFGVPGIAAAEITALLIPLAGMAYLARGSRAERGETLVSLLRSLAAGALAWGAATLAVQAASNPVLQLLVGAGAGFPAYAAAAWLMGSAEMRRTLAHVVNLRS